MVQNGPMLGNLGFEPQKYIKILENIPFQNHLVALGSEIAPPKRVLGLYIKYIEKYFKNLLLQNNLAHRLEIKYVAWPSSPLPNLYK